MSRVLEPGAQLAPGWGFEVLHALARQLEGARIHSSGVTPSPCGQLEVVGTVEPVTAEEIIAAINDRFEGLMPKSSWGETSLFYNPGRALPNGVYFCTVKDHDGANDTSSKLDRPGVFRLALGLPAARYEALFGPRPRRPAKGETVATGHDFTALDVLMPHPVYAWMGWVQILKPSRASFEQLQPMLDEAHRAVVGKFERTLRQRLPS